MIVYTEATRICGCFGKGAWNSNCKPCNIPEIVIGKLARMSKGERKIFSTIELITIEALQNMDYIV